MLRPVEYQTIVDAVCNLCMNIACNLSDDVLNALKAATVKESNPSAKGVLMQLLLNAQIAAEKKLPICQDTGLAVVFVEQGSSVFVNPPNGRPDATITDAINEGLAKGSESGYLRKSVVADPLANRSNTNNNCPAVIHYFAVSGDKIKISLLAKGGGCENKSRFKMFLPTAYKDDIIEWVVDVVRQAGADACPPFVIGVGLGGDFELAALLSKKALLRRLDSKNQNDYYADLETELLKRINAVGPGTGGLGGDTTALGVLVETAPCHIASLPAAVNIECHAHRHATACI